MPPFLRYAVSHVVWFTEKHGNNIGRLTVANGRMKEYPLQIPGSHPYGICLGPYRGTVRVTERLGDAIGVLPIHVG